MSEGGAGVVFVCLKLVELRATVDPLSGAAVPDPLSAGASPADEAALEWGLRCGALWGWPVAAMSAGTIASESLLRDALGRGASAAIRVEGDPDWPSEIVASVLSRAVERAIGSLGRQGVAVFCGDASLDRGSGAVPAFLAAELSAAQALGLVALNPADSPASGLTVERRLDRGRREMLRVEPPFVVSVEGGTARLRRAGVGATLAAQQAAVDTMRVSPSSVASSSGGAGAGVGVVEPLGVEAFRPRARVMPAPVGGSPRERILALTGAQHERPPARTVELGSDEAADEILRTLAVWGELPAGFQLGGDEGGVASTATGAAERVAILTGGEAES